MQWGGPPDQLDMFLRKADGPAKKRRRFAHALRMLTRAIIAILRRQGQALEDLQLGLFQLLRAEPHLFLECIGMTAKRGVEPSRLDQVVNPQQRFRDVYGLRQEVLGAQS